MSYFFGLNRLSRRELLTTETELKVIANPANSGLSTSPKKANARAAIGIPKTL